MRFNSHSSLAGSHAILSPSNYHWVNYDDQKIDAKVHASFAARRGTELHHLAQQMIGLGVKLPTTNQTLNMYVNDAIGYRMTPEQMLFYSPNCYGQADAIGYGRVPSTQAMLLRVFDLKTGLTQASVKQLEVYCALFCLEYGVKPLEIEMDLRIYQNDDVQIYEGDPIEVLRIMDRIVAFDRRINELRMEAY
jgi:hypothetical protein